VSAVAVHCCTSSATIPLISYASKGCVDVELIIGARISKLAAILNEMGQQSTLRGGATIPAHLARAPAAT